MVITYAEAFHLTKERKWKILESLCKHMTQRQLRRYISLLYRTTGEVGSPVSLAEDIAWEHWLRRFKTHPNN